MGRTVGPRVADALRFIGIALADLPPDTDPMLALMAEAVPEMERSSGYRRSVEASTSAGPIEATLLGEGRPVMLTGDRGVVDEVAASLAAHGFLAIAANIDVLHEAEDVEAIADAAAIDDEIALVRLDAPGVNAAGYTTAILRSLS